MVNKLYAQILCGVCSLAVVFSVQFLRYHFLPPAIEARAAESTGLTMLKSHDAPSSMPFWQWMNVISKDNLDPNFVEKVPSWSEGSQSFSTNKLRSVEKSETLSLDQLMDERSTLEKRLEQINSLITNSQKTEASNGEARQRDSSRSEKPPVQSVFASSKQDLKKKLGAELPNSCPYSFKVYVYPLPSSLAAVSIGEQARRNQSLHVCRKCILEQFSLEYIIHDFFTQFCGRTRDPSLADFFYLPLVRDAEFRVAMEDRSNKHNRAPSSTELALLDALEKDDFSKWKSVFGLSEQYWQRKKGADHIIVMPAPVTNLRHESSKRGFFHYMPHLYPPIFVGVEYSLSFVSEYPVCSTQKNIVVPYPTTDPDLFNGKLIDSSVQRTALIYYAGGVHGDCVEVRKAMKFLMVNSSKLPGVVPRVKSSQADREHGFLAAKFCPIPVGDSPSSKRMYDVLNFGCIPVVLSDDLVWAYTKETGGPLDKAAFSLQIPQATVQFPIDALIRKYSSTPEVFGYLPTGDSVFDILKEANASGGEYRNGVYVNPVVRILERISQNNIEIMQAGVREAAPLYRFYKMREDMSEIPTATHAFPDGGATVSFGRLLEQRLSTGLDKIADRCLQEKHAQHKYLSRYPCDTSIRR